MPDLFASLIRRFDNPQVLALTLSLTVGTGVVVFFGQAIAPFITAMVVAYLLEGMIRPLERLHLPRFLAVLLVFSLFILLLLLLFGVVLPILVEQLTQLLGEIPGIAKTLQRLLGELTVSVSGMIAPALVHNLLEQTVSGTQDLAASSVTYLLQGVPGLLSVLVYLFLVPFLVFFFLMDKRVLLDELNRWLPRERDLLYQVLKETDRGLGGYIRGKFWEMLLLGLSTYLVFAVMQFQYASLLGLLTGLSVLIPFLGVAVVTLPVILLALFQWGLTWEAFQPLLAYGILQAVDGTVVAPLILGETVRVHPTTIILSVLVFGHLWGLLGVFFAVPLAVLVKSFFDALPRHGEAESPPAP
ncbi:MAG: AI-2E family transporter [Magnetococcales bacterium]|nr:AI-2E family transporter [Magnetococcales bacterium]